MRMPCRYAPLHLDATILHTGYVTLHTMTHFLFDVCNSWHLCVKGLKPLNMQDIWL